MTFKFINHNFLNKNKCMNLSLSVIPYIYRALEESTSDANNQTYAKDTKKQQLKELYIYIAVLAAIIIIILVGYALYRKCVERKALQQLELEYQVMIYNILNSMSSQVSSSLQQQSPPRSYNGDPNIQNFDMRSEDINSENDYHEERMENLRRKYGNKILIKCLLKKQVETIEYTKKLEEIYGDKCTICMDGFEVGINIYKTPCEHIFHIKCFDKYLNGINKKDKLVCPNCNQNLLINKKLLKLRTNKIDVQNKKIINKEDNGKEIIINNSISDKEKNQDQIEKEKEKEKERAEIIYIKRITRNANKERRENKEENIYNPLKMKKIESLEKKDDTKNRSKRSIVFKNNEMKKSIDSNSVLYFGRNNANNYVNKMNSERHDINPKENKEEEKKEI